MIAYYIHLKIPVLLKGHLKDKGGSTDCLDDDPCKGYMILLEVTSEFRIKQSSQHQKF